MAVLTALLDVIDIPTAEEASELAEALATTPPQELWEKYRWPLITALIVLVVGYFVIKLLVSLAARGLRHSRLDNSSHRIILSSLKILLGLVVVLTAASTLGIPMTSTLALFSVFALAVSLAVKDGLSHFAGGIMILASKPFAVGDFIESKADGVTGTVQEIGLIHTKLKTLDHKQVFIPNGVLIASTVINYTGTGVRRADIVFPIPYSEDFHRAKDIIRRVAESNERVLEGYEPVIRVTELASSSVNILCRVWVGRDDYEDVKFDLLEGVMDAFGREGISIPFDQLDVHVVGEQAK